MTSAEGRRGVADRELPRADQLGPVGVRVNIISPGAIATPIFWGGHTNGQQISAEHAEARMAKYSRMAADRKSVV